MSIVLDGLVAATPHRSQFDGSAYQGENCGPTSIANGANTVTAGGISKTGAQVRSLVKRWEETNPQTPGWSIPDCIKAAARLGLVLLDRTNYGWAALVDALDRDQYVVVQGDSDQFGNGTCSGAFNGPHMIGIHPAKRTVAGGVQRWINDPICPEGRWEFESVLRRYAEKLHQSVWFAVFARAVPVGVPPKPAKDTDGNLAPAEIGTKPSGATMWVVTGQLHQLFGLVRSVRYPLGVLRPVYSGSGSFTFTAWAGDNASKRWASGSVNAPASASAVFRQVLGPAHAGLWIRVTDIGSEWHHLA